MSAEPQPQSGPSRVLDVAAALTPGRVVTAVVAAPCWLLGVAAGVVWALVVLLVAAVGVGFGDARRRILGADRGGA